MAQGSDSSVFGSIVTPNGRGFLSALGSSATVLGVAARLGLALRLVKDKT
jgi:hypothetical protein